MMQNTLLNRNSRDIQSIQEMKPKREPTKKTGRFNVIYKTPNNPELKKKPPKKDKPQSLF